MAVLIPPQSVITLGYKNVLSGYNLNEMSILHSTIDVKNLKDKFDNINTKVRKRKTETFLEKWLTPTLKHKKIADEPKTNYNRK